MKIPERQVILHQVQECSAVVEVHSRQRTFGDVAERREGYTLALVRRSARELGILFEVEAVAARPYGPP